MKIVKLHLLDRSYIFARGKIEYILVKVDKFIFTTYFVVLDMEEDKDVPIIMGRPFLATGRTLIDVAAGEMIMRVGVFNIFKAMKYLEATNDCFSVSTKEPLWKCKRIIHH